jgi:hypothetical protein
MFPSVNLRTRKGAVKGAVSPWTLDASLGILVLMEPLSGGNLGSARATTAQQIASVVASLRELTWRADISWFPSTPARFGQTIVAHACSLAEPGGGREISIRRCRAPAGIDRARARTCPAWARGLGGLHAGQPAAQRGARVPPQIGYPFRVELVVTYSLTKQGLMSAWRPPTPENDLRPSAQGSIHTCVRVQVR